MSKDMLGPLPRALVAVPIEYHGTLRDTVNRLSDNDVAKAAYFARDLKKFLRGEMGTNPVFTLYFHKEQKEGDLKGLDVLAHLRDAGLIGRCLSLEDEMVREWLDDPSTYPKEFKNKRPHLWGSTKLGPGEWPCVAFLMWDSDSVRMGWHWLEDKYSDEYELILLRSA